MCSYKTRASLNDLSLDRSMFEESLIYVKLGLGLVRRSFGIGGKIVARL
jgi:hypothetical protein